ncbi:MAG: SPOR domain-containing protein [Phycisphaerales bacterium]|nr:SPOR domain-containing protein [Phycisphaerales bacterium]
MPRLIKQVITARTRIQHAIALLAAAAALTLATGGCTSTSSTKPNDRLTFVEDYTAGNYGSAYAGATAAAGNQSLSAAEREQANLIAGEAAYAMDKPIDAERWLNRAVDSSDPLIRGKAQANLGLIAMDKGNMTSAAALLGEASLALMGDEAARCALYAGDAHRAQNNESDALGSYRRAAGLVKNDSELRTDISDRIAGHGPTPTSSARPTPAQAKGPFTLQLAAFSSPQKAQQHIAKTRSQSARLNLGAPHMVPAYRNGKILYTVRVGTFNARPDADRVKASFPGAIVTPVGS